MCWASTESWGCCRAGAQRTETVACSVQSSLTPHSTSELYNLDETTAKAKREHILSEGMEVVASSLIMEHAEGVSLRKWNWGKLRKLLTEKVKCLAGGSLSEDRDNQGNVPKPPRDREFQVDQCGQGVMIS